MPKWNKPGTGRTEETQRIPTEKGDVLAMLIAAWITFLPAAAVVLGVLVLLFFFWFL